MGLVSLFLGCLVALGWEFDFDPLFLSRANPDSVDLQKFPDRFDHVVFPDDRVVVHALEKNEIYGPFEFFEHFD